MKRDNTTFLREDQRIVQLLETANDVFNRPLQSYPEFNPEQVSQNITQDQCKEQSNQVEKVEQERQLVLENAIQNKVFLYWCKVYSERTKQIEDQYKKHHDLQYDYNWLPCNISPWKMTVHIGLYLPMKWSLERTSD